MSNKKWSANTGANFSAGVNLSFLMLGDQVSGSFSREDFPLVERIAELLNNQEAERASEHVHGIMAYQDQEKCSKRDPITGACQHTFEWSLRADGFKQCIEIR